MLGLFLGLLGVATVWVVELSTRVLTPELSRSVPPIVLAFGLATPLLFCGLFSLLRAFGQRVRVEGRP